MILKPKPTFDEFTKTCTPLLKIPELETEIRERISGIVAELLNFQPDVDPVNNLKQFIKRDENFLGVLLALTNLSQEKFLRILTAQRFAENDFGTEWGADRVYRMINRDDEFAEKIARLFLEGKNSRLLAEQVADFYLDQLSLPSNWSDVIRDASVIENVVRKKLTGEYTDKKGAQVEGIIRSHLDMLQTEYGITYAHGQVNALSINKEIDYALPSLDDPYIMIMSSYMETTSSSQTTRANEQRTIYSKIRDERELRSTERVFVNVVDGAGWLARRSDLRKMYNSCDYCLNMKTLDQLSTIICRYLPAGLFTRMLRPIVQEE
jgi:hypothetical protein